MHPSHRCHAATWAAVSLPRQHTRSSLAICALTIRRASSRTAAELPLLHRRRRRLEALRRPRPLDRGRPRSETPDWVQAAVPGFRGNKFWAPDVVKVGDRFYCILRLAIWPANLRDRPGDQRDAQSAGCRYEWVDRGPVIQSNEDLPYNAIDPAVLLDHEGKLWMAFGSFWEGLFLVELDPATGKRADPTAPPVHLARIRRRPTSRPRVCTSTTAATTCSSTGAPAAAASAARITCSSAARAPTGPFVDKNGVELTAGGGSPFLDAAGRYLGPGHVGFITSDDGIEYVSYHYYDGEDRGRSKLQLRKLRWTADGWPEVAEEPAAQ